MPHVRHHREPANRPEIIMTNNAATVPGAKAVMFTTAEIGTV